MSGRRPSETAPGEIQQLRDADVPDFLERHAVALLAFLGSDAASERLRPRLQVVASKWWGPGDQLGVGVVDPDRHPLVAEALHLEGVPSVIVFVDGEVVDRLLGSVPESVLDEVVRSRLPDRT